MEMRSIWPDQEPHVLGPRKSPSVRRRVAKVEARAPVQRPTSVPWSYSRRSVFERCPRRYYYEYYGASVRTARDEPEKAMLRQLKGLASRHERVGELLHLGIATTLRKAQQGTTMAPNQLEAWLCGMLEEDIAYSRADPDGLDPPARRYPPKLLREFHYRQPDAESLLAEAHGRLVEAVQAFASAPGFEPFRRAGAMPGALVEHRMRIPTLPVRVDGQMDLAYPDGAGHATVVDWKLGAADGSGDGSLQLAAYALDASIRFAVPAEQVRVVKAHLSTREIAEYAITERTLGLARTRILQDVQRMNAMHRYGQEAIVAAFSPTPSPRLCAQCPFQRLCPAGKELLEHA